MRRRGDRSSCSGAQEPEKEIGMFVRSVALVAVLGLLVCASPAQAGAEEASKSFVEGKALLAQGDFEGALKALKAAATADPENKDYAGEFALLRRVINMRERIQKEDDDEAWLQLARGLYSYYRDHKVNDEVLAIASKIHEKLNTGESAEMLSDAQLAADKNDEAAKLLDGLPADKQTLRTRILRGIALARVGKGEDARAVARQLELPQDADAQVTFDAARLYALVGERELALSTLRRSFEGTPVIWLDAVKAEAKESKDFQSLASSAEFAEVLKAESKVKGACGKCPHASKTGTCSSQKPGTKEKDAGCDHDKSKQPEKE